MHLPSSCKHYGYCNGGCSFDECTLHGDTCTNVGQTCEDPGPLIEDDWLCKCVAPSVGNKVGDVADCVLDECAKTCATCAGDACSKEGQDCADPNTSDKSTSDWVCTCPPPSHGSAIANTASCIPDECKEMCATCAGTTCSDATQECRDTNQDSKSLSDWECICPPPANTTAIAMVADCSFGECTLHGDTCTNVGQTCEDPGPLIEDDWKCVCPPPSEGEAVGRTADCVLDECVKNCPTCADTTCSAVGQTCLDADTSANKTGDWNCTCAAPESGTALVSAAHCTIDECVESCATCSNNVCTGVGQTCHDPDCFKQN